MLQARVPDRVDAAVNDVQQPAREATVDRSIVEAERSELAAGDYSVLPRREHGDTLLVSVCPLTWVESTPHITVDSTHVGHGREDE